MILGFLFTYYVFKDRFMNHRIVVFVEEFINFPKYFISP